MVDVYLIIGIVSAVGVVGGIVATNYWNTRMRKDKVVETRQTLQQDVEKVARDKFKEEQSLAKELAGSSAALALDVKQSMKEHVDRLIVTLKSDIELQRVQTYAKMDTIEQKTAQIKIDLMQHIIEEKDDRIRMQKSIDFFQTMQYGPDAKSMPAYMKGQDETEEHKDRPPKGVFASRAETTDEDTKDPET